MRVFNVFRRDSLKKMDWIKLSVEDFESVLNVNQLALLRAQSSKNYSRDFALDALNSAISLVRTNIAASGINMLDVDHSRIPEELRECTLRIALETLQSRLPALELSATQIRQGDVARQTLEKVCAGILPVSRPIVAIRTANRRKSISANKGSTNTATRKGLGGL